MGIKKYASLYFIEQINDSDVESSADSSEPYKGRGYYIIVR